MSGMFMGQFWDTIFFNIQNIICKFDKTLEKIVDFGLKNICPTFLRDIPHYKMEKIFTELGTPKYTAT